ncbi:MAG: hypothetical protein VR70_10185 [Rhodospirillaceae bacterium BRH_c57]|nr:MAG: hypothetical protein VR70_10185 [Rhodospirillaceae bacterium BRH_c57]
MNDSAFPPRPHRQERESHPVTYPRFAAMIATSTVVMFVLMYLNTYAWPHVLFSETRAYMAILMGATMAVIMMGYMFSMYPNRTVNIGIFVVSAVVFALSLWLVRSQATVSQSSYMKAMIPHHSIAIMTSKRAQISDPRVRKLADEIIEAQEREIAEMLYLIAALERSEGAPRPDIFKTEHDPEVMTVAAALRRTNIETLDLQPVMDAEAAKVLPPGPRCAFAWTNQSRPILVAGMTEDDTTQGVFKLQGALVTLNAPQAEGFGALAAGSTLTTEGASVRVIPVPDEDAETVDGRKRRKADMVFELERGLTVGYRGFYTCDSP